MSILKVASPQFLMTIVCDTVMSSQLVSGLLLLWITFLGWKLWKELKKRSKKFNDKLPSDTAVFESELKADFKPVNSDSNPESNTELRSLSNKSSAVLDKIIPVPDDFNWEKTEPRAYRPFNNAPYHLTMGLKKCDYNDFLLVENTYKDVTKIRGEIVENNRDSTVLSHPMADDAIREVYDWFIDYMVQKYPQYFVRDENNPVVHNNINNVTIPRYSTAFGDDIGGMIRTLSKNVEEDFLILIFDEDSDQYYLRAGSFAFPSGFNPAMKLNLPLKDVHGPVPMYKEKLQVPMDRYFKKIPAGSFVMRNNWTVQAHTNLYAPIQNHVHDDNLEIVPLKRQELDFSEVLFRSERQILTRLPKTGHVLFTIRTYTAPMTKIKQEGKGPDLIGAIHNLPPVMARYKNALKWGPAVIEFMSED
jgi:hypothetical protein